jgi:hypothetical protein
VRHAISATSDLGAEMLGQVPRKMRVLAMDLLVSPDLIHITENKLIEKARTQKSQRLTLALYVY